MSDRKFESQSGSFNEQNGGEPDAVKPIETSMLPPPGGKFPDVSSPVYLGHEQNGSSGVPTARGLGSAATISAEVATQIARQHAGGTIPSPAFATQNAHPSQQFQPRHKTLPGVAPVDETLLKAQESLPVIPPNPVPSFVQEEAPASEPQPAAVPTNGSSAQPYNPGDVVTSLPLGSPASVAPVSPVQAKPAPLAEAQTPAVQPTTVLPAEPANDVSVGGEQDDSIKAAAPATPKAVLRAQRSSVQAAPVPTPKVEAVVAPAAPTAPVKQTAPSVPASAPAAMAAPAVAPVVPAKPASAPAAPLMTPAPVSMPVQTSGSSVPPAPITKSSAQLSPASQTTNSQEPQAKEPGLLSKAWNKVSNFLGLDRLFGKKQSAAEQPRSSTVSPVPAQSPAVSEPQIQHQVTSQNSSNQPAEQAPQSSGTGSGKWKWIAGMSLVGAAALGGGLYMKYQSDADNTQVASAASAKASGSATPSSSASGLAKVASSANATPAASGNVAGGVPVVDGQSPVVASENKETLKEGEQLVAIDTDGDALNAFIRANLSDRLSGAPLANGKNVKLIAQEINNLKLAAADYTLVDGENGAKKVELTPAGRAKLFDAFLKKAVEMTANSHSQPYINGIVRNVAFAKNVPSGFSESVLKLYNSFQVKLTTLPKDVVGVAVDTNETSNTALKDFRASMPGEPSYENTVNQALEQLKKQPFNEATMKKVNAELAAQGASYKVTSYIDLFYHYAKVIAKNKQLKNSVDGSLGIISSRPPAVNDILKKKIDIKAVPNSGQGSGNGVEGQGGEKPAGNTAPGGSSVPGAPTGSVPPAGSAPAPSNTFGTNFYRQETGKDFGQFLMDGLKPRKHGGIESDVQKVAARQVESQKPQNLGDFLTDGLKLRKSVVQSTKVDDFSDVDNAFFAAGEKLSQQNVEEDVKNRQFVAANKGFFTLEDQTSKQEKPGFFSRALNAAKNFFKSPELTPEQQEMAELRKSIPKKSFFGSLFG